MVRGEFQEQRLAHREEAEKFYRELAARGGKLRVGMEASGQARWFERLLGELKVELRIGPTQTQAVQSGSPAIDAGNPSGCTDGSGNLLKTDQRGAPRPDKEDTGGCDMGAYERQTD